MVANPVRLQAKKGRVKIDVDIELVEEYAMFGLPIEDIANNLGISLSTLNQRRATAKEVDEAIKRGRSRGHMEISGSLYKSAKAGHVEAAKFYLARRHQWKEVQEHEVGGKDGGPIAITVVISKDDEAL
jgi:hypothetical protein